MKTMVGLVITILIIFTVTLFWPSTPVTDLNTQLIEESKVESEIAVVSDEELNKSASPELNTPADDLKIEQMTAEYKILEKGRAKLKQRLARLKHEMWGLKFQPEQAREMNEILLNAHKLIKNPDMLGAFSDVQGIKDEMDKIIFAEKALEDVESIVASNKQTTEVTK